MTDDTPDDIDPPSERDIQPGDLALDTAQGAFVYVLRRAADSVRAYMAGPDGTALSKHLLAYPGNWQTGGTDDDAVWTVQYVPSTLKTLPSQTYDFPASRLARVPVEVARDDLMRVQDAIAAQTLASTLQAFFGSNPDPNDLATFEQSVTSAGVALDTYYAAVELAYPNRTIEREREADQ